MKSEDFNVNEAINWFRKGPAFKTGPKDIQKAFITNFTKQYNPNIPINDFVNQYLEQNGWDVDTLPPAYGQSVEQAKQAIIRNPTDQNIQQLGNVMYAIASTQRDMRNRLGAQAGTATATKTATNKNPAAGDGQLDPNTNQIISKIRSIKNTPEEIDDLVDIIAISLFKLYKIAPKNYKRIVMSLFNNGGKPSMPSPETVNASPATPAQTDTSPTASPAQSATPTQTTTPSTAPSTPDYSGGVRKVAPSSITYNNNIKPVVTTTNTIPTVTPQPRGTVRPSNRNVEFTGQELGRIEPTLDKPKMSTLDKRINARRAAQAAMTTPSGLPK